MNISVVGLGYIGLPTAIILGLNEHNVRGFDIDESIVTKLNEGHIHIVEKGLQPLFEEVIEDGNFKAYSELQESDGLACREKRTSKRELLYSSLS